MLVQKTLHLAYMKSTEYYKEFCTFFYVFIHQPSARQRACRGGGDFVITTDLSLNHAYGYLLFAY